MDKKQNYKPLDDFINLSKTVRIGNDLHDVFPVSYNSIYKLTSSYLFIKSSAEFFEKIVLLSNPAQRLFNDFSLFNLGSQNLQSALFPAPSRDILTKEGRFINYNEIRNFAFLSNRWADGDLEFLSFHDLLIYKICSEFLIKKDKKVFIIKIGEEVRVSLIFSNNGNKATITNCPDSIVDSINSIFDKRKSGSFSLISFDELVKIFSEIAEKDNEELSFEDSFLPIIFGKIKLGQREFLTTSSAWFYEYWMENDEDFPEGWVNDDIKLFSDRVELIIDNEEIQKLLIELYKNLASLRRCNFSNPTIEEDLGIELKIKESYNHLVSIIESNQDLISGFFKNSEELKTYLTIKNKESLLRRFDSMLRFFKIKNYADKFFDKNLIDNQKMSAFTEEDGVFYKVVGVGDGSEEKNKEQKREIELFFKKEVTDRAKAFFNEGKLSYFTIFDHLTNTKKVIVEEKQIYVDSKELLQLLMKDFLEENYSKINFDKNSDLESLVGCFSQNIYEHFAQETSNKKLRGRKPNYYQDVWKIFIEKSLKGIFDSDNKDFAQQAFDAYTQLDLKSKNELKFFLGDSIVKNNINVEILTITEGKMGGKTSLNDNITIPFVKKFPKNSRL